MEDALAQELYAYFCARMATEGVRPDDPDLLKLLASMIGSHYAACGGRDKASIGKILDAVTEACRTADKVLDLARQAR